MAYYVLLHFKLRELLIFFKLLLPLLFSAGPSLAHQLPIHRGQSGLGQSRNSTWKRDSMTRVLLSLFSSSLFLYSQFGHFLKHRFNGIHTQGDSYKHHATASQQPVAHDLLSTRERVLLRSFSCGRPSQAGSGFVERREEGVLKGGREGD